jgi:nucleotide-binding universal stress UspA family protein
MRNKLLLVAVDGSATAVRAAQYAIKRAKETGSVSIHLVTAHEEPRVYGEIAVYVTREKMADLQRQAAEGALEEAEKLIRQAGVPCTREILVGPVASVIARRADELGCDSIVIGTHGMTAIGNLLMGSVATKIVHFAHVPVTLVK